MSKRSVLLSSLVLSASLPSLAFAQGSDRDSPAPLLSYGDPIQYQNITLVPVSSNAPGPFQRYTLLEQGTQQKTLQVRELDGNANQASVAEVEVRNKGDQPVFLLGGEMILGGQQDRIIQSDTVIPNDKRWRKVAVFCVEQGRWQGQKMEFSGSGALAHLKLQEAAMTGRQDEVWKEVARKNAAHGSSSQTQTFRRTIQNAKVRERLAKDRAELEKKLPSTPIAGMIFAINGKIQMADLFGNPVLFHDLEEKLLSAYILEAIEHQTDGKAKPLAKKDAQIFFEDAQAAPAKQVKVSGTARNTQKESPTTIGNDTVDQGTGKSVRETYISKQK